MNLRRCRGQNQVQEAMDAVQRQQTIALDEVRQAIVERYADVELRPASAIRISLIDPV